MKKTLTFILILFSCLSYSQVTKTVMSNGKIVSFGVIVVFVDTVTIDSLFLLDCDTELNCDTPWKCTSYDENTDITDDYFKHEEILIV